eukprot:TRINITY_DN25138_c0_g1_i1.p1 TRINITY_DN25138_c0_g1~~TRINITY_DN25138_c0_g1_i1.p1  ORF type:complete len:549 (+),score=91.03 TRINITY_DN25138_c0_g1_i1:1209-2855(+)
MKLAAVVSMLLVLSSSSSAEMEMQSSSVVAGLQHIESVMNTIVNAHLPTAENLQGMEKTLLSLSRLKTTKGMNNVITSIANITENGMKPAILAQLQSGASRLTAVQAAVTSCSGTLTSSLSQAQQLKNGLAHLKSSFKACVDGLIADASGANDGNPYVTGPSGCVTGGAAACNKVNSVSLSLEDGSLEAEDTGHAKRPPPVQEGALLSTLGEGASSSEVSSSRSSTSGVTLDTSGITWTNSECEAKSCPTTEASCILAHQWCMTFKTTDDATTLGNAGAQPTTTTCQALSTEPQGLNDSNISKSYFQRLFQYFGSWEDKWEEANCKCQLYGKACRGNISLCPGNDGSGTQCPSPESVLTPPRLDPTTCVSSGNTTNASACKDKQDALDKQACDYGFNQSTACNLYNTCYTSANSSLFTAYSDVCGMSGLLEKLNLRYYVVLRIECLLDAIAKNDTARSTAVDACKNKTIADYDLSPVSIPACDTLKSAWPSDAAKTNANCMAAKNISADQHISGTTPFANTYYADIQYPQTCVSDCCTSLPTNYVPLS